MAQQSMVDEEMTGSEFFPYDTHQLLHHHHPAPEPLAPSPLIPEKRGRGRRGKNANAGNAPNPQPSSNGASLGEPSGSGETPVPGRRGVVIKTKFPVARIKRIMQADEDVGKVAQVTPVVVSKALELFMISLCDKAAAQARVRNSRRITAGHLKEAVLHEDQFDFLAEIIAKVPDIPLPSENSHLGGANSGSGGEDDTAPPPQAVKKPRKPRQKKVKEGL